MSSRGGHDGLTIGFVATRISGNDGVSLEIRKWTEVLERMGHECRFIAGRCDTPPERSFVIEKADFLHPEVQALQQECFGRETRSRGVSRKLDEMTRELKEGLYEALRALELDVIIAQNCLTIPMNLPLGVALVETLLETGMPSIAHHHDFVWERDRFLVNAVDDYLRAAFPPPLPEIKHVVLNTLAGEEFSRRTGLSCHVIPNVMNFAHPPEVLDDYANDFRQTIGLAPGDAMILQPTRIVRRKGIEHAVELVRRLEDMHAKLVITYDDKDEGPAYRDYIVRFAELLGVEPIFAAPWVSVRRGTAPDGRKQYSIWDVYPQADLVAYASTYEGFGNAFVEAVYYRKPLLCNRYTIYRTDIEPLGFRAVVMDGFLCDDCVDEVRRILTDEDYRDEMVEHNYRLGREHFSYERLEAELESLLARVHLPC